MIGRIRRTLKGLERAMHWGYPLDSEVDHELVVLLGEHLPAVRWTGGPHQIGACGQRLLRCGLGRQAPAREINQRAAA